MAMGFDYALVHLKYTIPPAIALTLLYRPLLTALDVYKLLFLITVAVTATIPWDSYLIRERIWSYPESAVVGYTLFRIPVEELFFFVIQTYNTSLLYSLLSKPVFYPKYLPLAQYSPDKKRYGIWQQIFHVFGLVSLAGSVVTGAVFVFLGGRTTYLGLIILWAMPVLLFLWTISGKLIIRLPFSVTILPIALPTIYLWIVDTLALGRGTWVIETGTKMSISLWYRLDIEEALFFLLTNTLIVFGMIAFDYALSLLYVSPTLFPTVADLPSPLRLSQALYLQPPPKDMRRAAGLADAVDRLRRKSRSFYLASATFPGRLRIDLILLYSFCRAADDLIDDSSSAHAAKLQIERLKKFLELRYDQSGDVQKTNDYIVSEFPHETHSALMLLPTEYLPQTPLLELVRGFETDVLFDKKIEKDATPIDTTKDLDNYGFCVAGTVAELCLALVFHYYPFTSGSGTTDEIIQDGIKMGIALQYINITRDVAVDADIGRVYIPISWLKDADLSPSDVIKNPTDARLQPLREKLLKHAFTLYGEARPAIEKLPPQARAAMRVAVESYLEIGRVLREMMRDGSSRERFKATVPIQRRIWVAWKALSEG